MEQRKLEGAEDSKALAKTGDKSQLPREDIAIGDINSFVLVFEKLKDRVEGLIWNEERIELITKDRSTRIMFAPELTPEAELFFQRRHKNHTRYDDEDSELRIQEFIHFYDGEYEPVQFSKRSLLKFLKAHVQCFPQDIQEAVKNLKVSQIVTVTEQLLDEDSDNQRSISDQQVISNLPNSFQMGVTVTEGHTASLQLEAKPCKIDTTRGIGVQLQCTNAREVMRELMEHVIMELPPGIPRYYGARRLSGDKG